MDITDGLDIVGGDQLTGNVRTAKGWPDNSSKVATIDASAIGDRVIHVLTPNRVVLYGLGITGGNLSTYPVDGGGIAAYEQSDLVIKQSMVTNNRVSGGLNFLRGAGIYSGNSLVIGGSQKLIVKNSLISSNIINTALAITIVGVGITFEQGDRLTIKNSSISQNSGLGISFISGVGVYATTVAEAVEIWNTVIKDNVAEGRTVTANIHGVGLHLDLSPQAASTISNSEISNNSGTSENIISGGAIYTGSSPLKIVNTTISSNSISTAPVALNPIAKGGAIYCLTCADIEIKSSTIHLNHSSKQGGGIYVATGDINMSNSIIAGNTSSGVGSGSQCEGLVGNGISSGGYNIIGDNTNCSVVAGPNDQIGDPLGTGVIDPLLGPLQLNGDAVTSSHEPTAASSAIDAGPLSCTDGLGVQLVTDQSGRLRHIDGDNDGTVQCDIGAIEVLLGN